MTILTLLEELLGPAKQYPSGENYFTCPVCNNKQKKFAVNQSNLLWHCWHCNARGNIKSLFRVLKVSPAVYKRYAKILGEELPGWRKNSSIVQSKQEISLPDEYKPLWEKKNTYPYRNAVAYLQSRGMTAEDVLRYRIGYCETGLYANRVIIPSYDYNNVLNYFTARSFYPGGMKYKNPPVSKNVVCFENMVDWSEAVILCEGMFDAISIRRNAIPMLGKTLPKLLENRLVENKTKKVVVFLDVDAHTDAMKLEHHLRQYGIDVNVVLSEKKDASEIGFDESWRLIGEAKKTGFKELIVGRLGNI